MSNESISNELKKQQSNELDTSEAAAAPRRGLSLDTWAVVLALAAAALVKLHILNTVKW